MPGHRATSPPDAFTFPHNLLGAVILGLFTGYETIAASGTPGPL
jgi:hypothetical protein